MGKFVDAFGKIGGSGGIAPRPSGVNDVFGGEAPR